MTICAPRLEPAGDDGQHRHADALVVAAAVERQRPEVRRRPHEDDEEEQDAFERDAARDGGPADHGREGAGGTADDDVLRRPALQPHGVDEDVEGDRQGEQRAGHPVDQHAEREHRADGEHGAEGQCLLGRDPAARDGARRRALHVGVDVGVVPHVERAGRAGADGDAEERDGGERGMQRARRQPRGRSAP